MAGRSESNIERWTSVRNTPLANRLGVAGYYVPVLPGQALAHREIRRTVIPIHNRPGNEKEKLAIFDGCQGGADPQSDKQSSPKRLVDARGMRHPLQRSVINP